MKTAISVPDDIYVEAERLARRLKKSRSKLYAEAMAEYLQRHDSQAVTAAFDRVCAAVEDGPDDMVTAAARRTLSSAEW